MGAVDKHPRKDKRVKNVKTKSTESNFVFVLENMKDDLTKWTHPQKTHLFILCECRGGICPYTTLTNTLQLYSVIALKMNIYTVFTHSF